MKRTKNMIYKASDEARELFLYATNKEALYRQMIKPAIENLRKKVAKGTYDADKAADLFYSTILQTERRRCITRISVECSQYSRDLQQRLIWLASLMI